MYHFFLYAFAVPLVCNLFCLSTSMKICLTISFVSSSHVLVSSALIPLLSPVLPFFFESVDGSLQFFSREFWNFVRLFHVGSLIDLLCCFQSHFLSDSSSVSSCLFIIIQFAVEFSKDIGNSFSWCIDFAFFIFYLTDEYPFFSQIWCRSMFLNPFGVLREFFESFIVFLHSYYLVSDAFSFLFAQALFLTFGSISLSFFNKPSESPHLAIETSSWTSSDLVCCCCCSTFSFLLVFFCIFIKSFSIQVALGTDCDFCRWSARTCKRTLSIRSNNIQWPRFWVSFIFFFLLQLQSSLRIFQLCFLSGRNLLASAVCLPSFLRALDYLFLRWRHRRWFFFSIFFMSVRCAACFTVFLCLSLSCIMGAILYWCIHYECCHDTSVVTAHV